MRNFILIWSRYYENKSVLVHFSFQCSSVFIQISEKVMNYFNPVASWSLLSVYIEKSVSAHGYLENCPINNPVKVTFYSSMATWSK